jgi:hypothetical protein
MEFERFANGQYKGWIRRGFNVPHELANGRLPISPEFGADLLLKCRARHIFRVAMPFKGTRQSCFVYIFRNESWGRSLRQAPPLKILRISRRMQARGFTTIEVLAALKPRKELLNWNSLLIVTEIPSVCELSSTGNHVYPIHESIGFTPAVSTQLARDLSRFHESSFIHGDLKARHVLVQSNGIAGSGDDSYTILLVDLEKSMHLPHTPRLVLDVLNARDLVQLFASLPNDRNSPGSDRAREEFLRTYLSSRNLSPTRSRRIREIIQLYEPGGMFRQGRTLFSCLFDLVRKRLVARRGTG